MSDKKFFGDKKTLYEYLEKAKNQYSRVLPKSIDADRFIRIVFTTVNRTPKLMQCTAASFMNAVMTAAQLGLEPDGAQGHCSIIPRNGEAKFQIEFKGLIKLARNSPNLLDICAQPVGINDKFDFALGLNERLEHVPNLEDPGSTICFYSIAKFVNGGHHIEFMTKKSVEKIRDRSDGYRYAKKEGKTDTPWITDFDEMGRKTIVKRISKYLDLPPMAQKAIAIDTINDVGGSSYLDEEGMVVMETEPDNKETDNTQKIEHKPTNLAEFEKKFATPAPEPVEAKPEPKAVAPAIKSWMKQVSDINGAVNKAKTADEINKLINTTYKVTLADMKKDQPVFHAQVMDNATNMQVALAQTP